MTAAPSPTPAERFALTLASLAHAVITRAAFGLPQAMIALILARIREINQRFARLAERVRQGRYVLRRHAAARRPRGGNRRRDELPHRSGWLTKLVPDALAHGSQLEILLRDPEMVALLAAAPVSMSRPIRSLCRMLGVTPPPILAPASAPRAAPNTSPPPASAAAPRTTPPAPSPRPGGATAPPACACGPPLPA